MKAFVLTYHSHHVVGADYSANDHVAFPQDLRTATECGYQIVPLSRIVERFSTALDADQSSAEGKYLALTFDDGPIFDIDDFVHPVYGNQRSFLNEMIRFIENAKGSGQPHMYATSFVIASRAAREVMESTADLQYTYLSKGSLHESWWNRALDTGLFGIGNHSWDHLHPALPRVAHSRQARADFTQVDNEHDADAQILRSAAYISSQTRGRSSPFFAFPFGHDNAFLTEDYLPRKGAVIGVEAAFSTRPSQIAKADSRWSLPRITCGHHWTSTDALAKILTA